MSSEHGRGGGITIEFEATEHARNAFLAIFSIIATFGLQPFFEVMGWKDDGGGGHH